jgi:hypothetical protein
MPYPCHFASPPLRDKPFIIFSGATIVKVLCRVSLRESTPFRGAEGDKAPIAVSRESKSAQEEGPRPPNAMGEILCVAGQKLELL